MVEEPFTSPELLSNMQVTSAAGTTDYPTAAASHVVSPLYVYNNTSGGYQLLKNATDLFNPWDGAWIYSRQNGTKLVFRPNSA